MGSNWHRYSTKCHSCFPSCTMPSTCGMSCEFGLILQSLKYKLPGLGICSRQHVSTPRIENHGTPLFLDFFVYKISEQPPYRICNGCSPREVYDWRRRRKCFNYCYKGITKFTRLCFKRMDAGVTQLSYYRRSYSERLYCLSLSQAVRIASRPQTVPRS